PVVTTDGAAAGEEPGLCVVAGLEPEGRVPAVDPACVANGLADAATALPGEAEAPVDESRVPDAFAFAVADEPGTGVRCPELAAGDREARGATTQVPTASPTSSAATRGTATASGDRGLISAQLAERLASRIRGQ